MLKVKAPKGFFCKYCFLPFFLKHLLNSGNSEEHRKIMENAS
jgi:hypothetical protein